MKNFHCKQSKNKLNFHQIVFKTEKSFQSTLLCEKSQSKYLTCTLANLISYATFTCNHINSHTFPYVITEKHTIDYK